MRVLMVLAGMLPALAGCGASEEGADANAAAVNYRPPSVTSRLDYGGQVERRFHRLDKDVDDKLSAAELPERMRRTLLRGDTNGDGSLSSEEWGALMLKRFDRQDLNKDGTVTTEERVAERAARKDRREDASGDEAAR